MDREHNKQSIGAKLPVALWSYFYKYVKGYRNSLIWSSIGYISLSFFVIPNLILVKYIFDEAIPDRFISGILLSGVVLIALRLISVIATILLRKVSLRITTSIVANIRADLLAVIYRYTYMEYSNVDIRRHNVQMVQDTERVSGLFTTLVSRLGPSLVISITLIIILFVINQFLFAIVAFFIPLIAVVNYYLGKTVKLKTQEYQESFEDFSNSNMFILKYLNLIWLQSTETKESASHQQLINRLKLKTEKQGLFGSFQTQVQTLMVSSLGIAVLVAGGVMVANQRMTLGDFFAFYIAANQLNNQLNAISGSYSSIVSGNVSLAKLFKLFHSAKSEVYLGQNRIESIRHIQMLGVSFDYGVNPVLSNVAIRISMGDVIGLVGPNGSGKSTLIQMILGLIRPINGKVMVNDQSFDQVDLKAMRRNMGVVTQYPMLLPGTIMFNISYGSESAKETDFEEAVRAALVQDFVKRLPKNYQTEIGEDGTYLSGGERQKLAIARALIRKPDLVILDEPTNHLDKESVKRIMDNIRRLPWNPAVVLISHDKGVVSYVDQVYQIENCRLIRR